MNRMRLPALFAAGVLVGQASAMECEAPRAVDVPMDVETLSRDDFAQVFRSIKSYQARVGDYRECLDANSRSIGSRKLEDLHNASVSEEEEVVARFNALFDAFKSRRAR